MAGCLLSPPPAEDAVPEVLRRRQLEEKALSRLLEKSGGPISPSTPPRGVALLAGAMNGHVVELKVRGGGTIPAWVGCLAAGRSDDPDAETESIAAACLDALPLAEAEALASTLAARGLSVYPAPLPAVSSYHDPVRRRRAPHADPRRHADQALFKARHALEALLELAGIPAIDRPMILLGSLGALDELLATRRDHEAVVRAGCAPDEPSLESSRGAPVPLAAGHRSAVGGDESMALWRIRPPGGGGLLRLRVSSRWWGRHGSAGADLLSSWILWLSSQGGDGPVAKLLSRLASRSDPGAVMSSIADLVA